MQTSEHEPLNPAAGGINCIAAERPVSNSANIATLGKAELVEVARLTHDVGAALIQLAMEHGGTVEIQVQHSRTNDEVKGITTHGMRVDIWKARQRQYLRMPVKIDATATEKRRFPSGRYKCTHCDLEHVSFLPFDGKLPQKFVTPCERCSLPIHLQLVDVEGKTNG